ncbi:MAG TPA: hypothetical protein VN325_34460 [Steroidobacteraceae bacterium]|nr:hypothetical protein [Steroidobacteraceae bacterium]
MAVRIDQARQHRLAAAVDDLRIGILAVQSLGVARFDHLAEVEHEAGERFEAIADERVSVDVLHQLRCAARRHR